MQITSSAVDSKEQILKQYTCNGKNYSPPLTFSEVPIETQSLALIMEDPDAPNGIFTHWILFDMSPATLQLGENQPPMTGKNGTNDFGHEDYGGPCPPSGSHRYFFKLYALDIWLNAPAGISRQDLLSAIDGHIIASAELVGSYTQSA